MRTLLPLLALAITLNGYAQDSVFEEREFETVDQERRYQHLINELRCLVCQNQAIADSNADLAAQLRAEVHSMLVEGASDEDVRDFMVARYGDFVLFDPPMKTTTALLWVGPFALLIVSLGFLFQQIHKRRRRFADELEDGSGDDEGNPL